MSANKLIKIRDLSIDREHYPKLYEWATINPGWLEKTLVSMQEKQGGTLEVIASLLENDLSHSTILP